MASLSLVSLNIERSKHLDTVLPFMRERNADVVCLQELMQKDTERLARATGATDTYFVPMGLRPEESDVPMGIAILARPHLQTRNAKYYKGDPRTLPVSIQSDSTTYNTPNRMTAVGDIEKDGMLFRIATTHFTWSARGKAVDEQWRDMAALLSVLDDLGEFVLCGDFNAPRGGELFAELSSRYEDNIPTRYKTSIDASLHRAGKTNATELATKMVDGLFSTPSYAVSEVELVSGVSDHMAIVATISETN